MRKPLAVLLCLLFACAAVHAIERQYNAQYRARREALAKKTGEVFANLPFFLLFFLPDFLCVLCATFAPFAFGCPFGPRRAGHAVRKSRHPRAGGDPGPAQPLSNHERRSCDPILPGHQPPRRQPQQQIHHQRDQPNADDPHVDDVQLEERRRVLDQGAKTLLRGDEL